MNPNGGRELAREVNYFDGVGVPGWLSDGTIATPHPVAGDQ